MGEADSIYPRTPDGWTAVDRHRIGPFTTHVTFRLPNGSAVNWSSRFHRKHASVLSRATGPRRSVWCAPGFASWWIGVLFAIGSLCFFLGPFPGFLGLVGAGADGIVFFAGSIFFTSAALLQYLEAASADEGPGQQRASIRILSFEPMRIDWLSSVIQLAGTIFFNISTFEALKTGLAATQADKLVWAPDAFGSICFLASGILAYLEVRGGFSLRREPTLEWRIGAINLLGCALFGASAIASFIVPASGSIADLAAANVTTSAGALCFLIGAILLLPEGAGGHFRSSEPASS